MRKIVFTLFAAALLATASYAIAAPGLSGRVNAELAAVRAATAKYHRVAAAEADGYMLTSPCEESAEGGMGHHYLNPSLLTPGVDPLRPEILLYAPVGNTLRLVGVEYFTVDADQNLATDDDRPSLFGRGFDGPMLGHAPGMPIHYDLHVWIWKANPSGVLEIWNPALDCP
jgi:hypothetical protein